MSKIKAVVLEKSGSRYTVLGENGAFRHVRRRQNAEVGEEIEIQTPFEGFRGLRMWAGIAAMFLLVLTTLFSWNLYNAPTAVALLSVDINPSIQFTIDARGQLIKIDTQNKDAERLFSKFDLKGKPIDKVLGQIVTEAYNQRLLNPEQPWVVVGYSPLINDTEQVPMELNEHQILSWVAETVMENGFTPQVEFFALNPQDRELARKGNLTLGEYALWQTAVKAGVETQPEKLRDTSERVRLLEDPKVRAQVKKDKKGIKAASPVKGSIPGRDKGKEKEADNSQKKEQGDKNKKGNDKEKEIGNDKAKGTANEKETEEEKETGQKRKETQEQINSSDKVMNNQGNGPSSTEHPSSQNDERDRPKNVKD